MPETVNGSTTAAERLRALRDQQRAPQPHTGQRPVQPEPAAPPPTGPSFRGGASIPRAAAPAAAAATAASIPDLAALPGELPVPWDEIERLRGDVAARLASEEQGSPVTDEARQERARAVITGVVAAWSQERSRRHGRPLSPQAEAAVKQAVFDAHFRAGPLQRYLDMPGVEEIWVDGCDQVVVDCAGKGRQRFPGLLARESDLIDLINRMAKSSGHGERRLTDASPIAHFRLPDNSRAVATLRPLSSRTTLTIRVHGARRAGLAELKQWGSISESMRQFLTAAVLANKTIIVAGAMGAGKTTLIRGLARVVPATETVVTLESDRELFLDEDRDDPQIQTAGAHVMAFEERRSNGEDGDAGEITVGDLIPHALRMGARRIIVGEVRDEAAVSMLDATSAGGRGTLTTLHAISPETVIPRLEQLCLKGGMTAEGARSLISTSVNFIVYMHQELHPVRRRWISHIWEISPGENGPARQPIYQPFPEGGEERGVPGHPGTSLPSCLPDLEKVGLHRGWLTPEYGGWEAKA